MRNGGFIDASGRPRAAFGQGADPVRLPPPSRHLPPSLDDEATPYGDGVPAPDEMDFESDADEMATARSTAGTLDALDRTSFDRLDPARLEAQRAEAPSKMRKVDRGVTVDDQHLQDGREDPGQ